MSWSRILFFYLASAVLGGYLYLVHGPSGAPQVQPILDRPFVQAVASRIDHVVLTRDDFAMDFRRKDDRWVVSGAAQPDIGRDLIEALLDTLTTIPAVGVVSEEGESDSAFGLRVPSTRVRMDSAGSIVTVIAFGERNPTGTAVYVNKAGQDRVYLLGLNALYYLDLIFQAGVPQAGGTAQGSGTAQAGGPVSEVDVVAGGSPQAPVAGDTDAAADGSPAGEPAVEPVGSLP